MRSVAYVELVPVGYMPAWQGKPGDKWVCDHGAVWEAWRQPGHGYNEWRRRYGLVRWRAVRAARRERGRDDSPMV